MKTLKLEGYVVQVEEETFIARLWKCTGSPVYSHNLAMKECFEATIPLQEISEEDLKLVTPGAIFYWTIGYLAQASDQRIQRVQRVQRVPCSIIRFRRFPVWTAREIEEARNEAEQLGKNLRIS